MNLENNNVAGGQNPPATPSTDLKQEVVKMLKEGKSRDEINAYVKANKEQPNQGSPKGVNTDQSSGSISVSGNSQPSSVSGGPLNKLLDRNNKNDQFDNSINNYQNQPKYAKNNSGENVKLLNTQKVFTDPVTGKQSVVNKTKNDIISDNISLEVNKIQKVSNILGVSDSPVSSVINTYLEKEDADGSKRKALDMYVDGKRLLNENVDENEMFKILGTNPNKISKYVDATIDKQLTRFGENILNGSDYKYGDILLDEDFENVNIGGKSVRRFKPEDTLNVIGNVDDYGLNVIDFTNFLNKNYPRLLELNHDGHVEKWKDSPEIEKEVFNAYNKYTEDRFDYLKNKYVALSKYSALTGVNVDDKIEKIENEISSLSSNGRKFLSEKLPSYNNLLNLKKQRNIEEYKNAHDSESSTVRSIVNNTGNFINDFFRGGAKGVVDIYATAQEYLGSSKRAEELRMSQRLTDEYYGSTDDIYESGKMITYKNGNKYIVTDKGQIIDVVSKKNITSYAEDLGIDTKELYEQSQKEGVKDSVFSVSAGVGMFAQTLGQMLPQIASQAAIARGAGIITGSKDVGLTIASLTTNSTVVYSNVYAETMGILAEEGMSNQEASKNASIVALSATAASSLVSPWANHQGAISSFSKGSINKRMITEAIETYNTSGSKGLFTKMLDYSFKSVPVVAREAFTEMLQEGSELVGQKIGNNEVNNKLGDKILDTNITTKEILTTLGMAGAVSGTISLRGAHKTGLSSVDKMELFANMSSNMSEFDIVTNDLVNNGVYSRNQIDDLRKKVDNFRKYANKLPDNINDDKFFETLDLVSERNVLEEQKKNVDKAFHQEINDKIKNVDEKIKSLLSSDRSSEGQIETIGDLGNEQEETSNKSKPSSNDERVEVETNGTETEKSSQEIDEEVYYAPLNLNDDVIEINGEQIIDSEPSYKYDKDGNLESITMSTINGEPRVYTGDDATKILFDRSSKEMVEILNGSNPDEILSENSNFDKFIEHLDKVILAVDNHSKGTLNALGVPAKLAVIALKTIKTTAITGKSTIDSIKEGIKIIKQSDWYKKLSPEERLSFNNSSEMDLFMDIINSGKKKDSSADTFVNSISRGDTTTKQSVREVTGQTDTSQKITLTESKLLKDYYQTLAKGTKDGFKYAEKVKRELAQQIKDVTRGLGDYAKDLDISGLLKMVADANDSNIDQIQTRLDKIINRLEDRSHKNRLSKLKKLQKRASKKAKKVYGDKGSNIRELSSLNVDSINDENLLNEYEEIINSLVSEKNVNFDNVNDLYERIKPLISAQVEQKRVDRERRKEGIKTDDELISDYNKVLKEYDKNKNDLGLPDNINIDNVSVEDIPNTINKINDIIKEGIIKKLSDNIKKVKNIESFSEMEQEMIKAFLNTPKKYLDSLNNKQLLKLNKALLDINDKGFIRNKTLFDAITDYNSTVAADNIKNSISDIMIKPAGGIRNFIRNNVGKRVFTSEIFAKRFEQVMLHHIDTAVTKIKGTPFYSNVVHPLTAAFNKVDNNYTVIHNEFNKIIREAVKSSKKSELDLNIDLQFYLRQREYESNKDLATSKVFSLSEHIEAMIKNEKMIDMDTNNINHIIERFNNTPKTAEEMFKNFNNDEKNIIKFIDATLNELKTGHQGVNNHVRGESLHYYNDYFPLSNTLSKKTNDEISVSERLISMMNGDKSAKSDSSNMRIATQANPLRFDTTNIFLGHVKETMTDIELSPVIKQVHKTINKVKNTDNESLNALAHGLDTSINNLISYQLSKSPRNSDTRTTRMTKAFVRRTFTKILVDPIKLLAYDIPSNYLTIYGVNIDRLPEIMNSNKKFDKNFAKVFAENISSTQIGRVAGARAVDYKNSIISSLGSKKYSDVNYGLTDKFLDAMTKNQVTDFSDWLGVKYYELADAPTQHMWKYYVMNEFKKMTGSELNIKRFTNDSEYRQSVKSDLQKATAKADKLASNIGNTGASSEQKLSIQNDKNNFITKMNSFMRSFTFNENRVFFDSLNGLLGSGPTTFDSKSEALRAFGIVNARGIMYSYLASTTVEYLAKAIGAADDDDKLEEEALVKSLAQHAMLIGFGNKSTVWNLAAAGVIEGVNKMYVESQIDEEKLSKMRKTMSSSEINAKGIPHRKYSSYDDGLVFSLNGDSKGLQIINSLGAEGVAIASTIEIGDLSSKMIVKFMSGEEITDSDWIEWKTAKRVSSFAGQVTGLPIMKAGSLIQKKLDYDVKKEKEAVKLRKERGF